MKGQQQNVLTDKRRYMINVILESSVTGWLDHAGRQHVIEIKGKTQLTLGNLQH